MRTKESALAVSAERRRTRVVLPSELVYEINERVGQRRRSEFIQEAVEEKLNRLRRVEAFKRVGGSIADGEIPEWETRESTSAWLHDLRQDRDSGDWFLAPQAKANGGEPNGR